MTTTIYNKLVRDGIPAIIFADGHECTVRSLDLEEYRGELKRKLFEESREVSDAPDECALIEELADMLEVIYALGSSYGRSALHLDAVRIEKRSSRGGFEDRLFLQTVTTRG